MSKNLTDTKIVVKDELYGQFEWFNKNILSTAQNACDEFFSDLFSLKLVGISENINVLSQGEDYFVTKIRIDKQHDAHFRCSASAVEIILNKTLGDSAKFSLEKMTELEAKIISSFNDYIYNHLSKFLIRPQQIKKAIDTIHLTFFIKEKSSDEGAKIIISLPKDLLSPNPVISNTDKFDISDFKNSRIDANVKVGTTKFTLQELKNLEKEDIVIFENSDIHEMELIFEDYRKNFKISPNPGLIISIDDKNGGHHMEGHSLSQNLWDNIQVEMGAEFEKVKITLGELKNIEQGLVIDLSSVYDNKISLLVENKVIAKGELVIINDRYGVRVDEVFASEKNEAQQISQVPAEEQHFKEEQPIQESHSDDEEFDYSDFDLDDEDI